MTSFRSPLARAVAVLPHTLSHRRITERPLVPDDDVRPVARRLTHLGLARDELARLSGQELGRLLRRRRHRHVRRASGGAA